MGPHQKDKNRRKRHRCHWVSKDESRKKRARLDRRRTPPDRMKREMDGMHDTHRTALADGRPPAHRRHSRPSPHLPPAGGEAGE